MPTRKDRAGDEPGTRICNRCEIARPEAEYGVDRTRYDLLKVRCKPCEREVYNARRASDVDGARARERAKAYKQYTQSAEVRARINARNRAYGRKRRLEVIARYGGFCACCGESQMQFLAIDHIDGGGNAHRREVGNGDAFYKWLRGAGFPEGFRVLCHNCNLASGFYGRCPHEEGVNQVAS